MMRLTYQASACALAVASALAWGGLTTHADQDRDNDHDRREGGRGRTVFVVAMENHNWTQPSAATSPQPIFMNPEAPFINSLVNGTSGISSQVAYATNYLNAGLGIHPSEPSGSAGTPLKGDPARIAQGDNFLARIVPLLMTSDAYEDHGIIVLWWDESEGGDTPAFTLPFIVISKDVHKNVGGTPFASSVEYSHSSFLRTMQEIFDVDPDEGFGWLGEAAIANDLSALFKAGTLK